MRFVALACALAGSGCHAITTPGDYQVVDVVGEWARSNDPDVVMTIEGNHTGSTELPLDTIDIDFAILWSTVDADNREYGLAHYCDDALCAGIMQPDAIIYLCEPQDGVEALGCVRINEMLPTAFDLAFPTSLAFDRTD